MIRITKVEFENYRQYRHISILFKAGEHGDLHILRAKNGTGKTTFLNGILWCLYAKEHYLNDKEKALAIVNNALVQQSKPNDSLKVTVRLTLNDEGEIITFERTQNFFVIINPMNNAKNTKTGQSKLRIIKTPTNTSENSTVIEDEAEVQSIVKQYFDEAIYDYYFFDGENLKSYFIRGKSEKIKTSIFNISQVTLLKNASNHAQTIADEMHRQASKINREIKPDLVGDIQSIEKEIDRLEIDNASIEQALPELERVIEEADATLQGYSPIRLNIEKRAMLDKELKTLEIEYENFISEKNTFITTYWTLLNFYPRAKFALDLILDKQASGTLPPNIDKEQIQSLLNDHAKNCPVCNSVLDEKAIIHLKNLLEKLDVSSATSNFLMEIKGGLETIVSRCKNFPSELNKMKKKEKYYIESINEKQKTIDDISAFLAQYSDEKGSVDVKKIEIERKQAKDSFRIKDQRLALNLNDIKRLKEKLEAKKSERDEIEAKQQRKNQLSKQITVYRKLHSLFNTVQNSIMDEIKEDIQCQTWKRFSSMLWKKNTFGRIEINDKYELTVFNMDNNQMTGSLSATENMALAYSFTLAIHDASGKNCPLVVDSPLGRVSDDNRSNMATELLKVSNNKQIIMLFTPDEYSEEVKSIYDNSAASIRDICLSDNEKEIKDVGDVYA